MWLAVLLPVLCPADYGLLACGVWVSAGKATPLASGVAGFFVPPRVLLWGILKLAELTTPMELVSSPEEVAIVSNTKL